MSNRATAQLKNKLTGMITDEQTAAEELPATWESHVLIPLVQNLLGGAAVAIVFGALAVGFARKMDAEIDRDSLIFWCSLAGVLVSGLATIVRFFGDDLGIVAAAYTMGRRQADAQLSAMQGEVNQLRAIAKEIKPEQFTQRNAEMLERIAKAEEHAKHLLALAYGGHSIAREQVSAYIPQRAWERAMNLMRAAGCLDGNSKLVERNLASAQARLDTFVKQDRARAQGGTWAPRWLIEAKH